MSRLLLPLRSSTKWFSSEAAQLDLERELKNYVLLYDEVVVQNGRYLAKYSKTGFFDHFTTAAHIQSDRAKLSYHSPDDPFLVQVSAEPDGPYHPVFQGPITASYEVDFFPLLNAIGLSDVSFIKWWDADISHEGKQIVESATQVARSDPELMASLTGDPFMRGRVLNGLYVDSLLAQEIGASFCIDGGAGSLFSTVYLVGCELGTSAGAFYDVGS
jgi:hypothetical protein